ncbi:MAG: sigma 54-interacting transcriptional regulator, partial [Candidatus Binatia bacterium]
MLRRLFRALLCTFAVLAAFAFVQAGSRIGRPFPGFLVYANGMVSAFGADDWTGVRAGLDAWDIIREIDGRPVATAREILAIVRAEPPGTLFRYTVLRGDRLRHVTVASSLYGLGDFVREPLPWLLTGTFAGAAGLFIHYARPAWMTFGFAAFGVALGVALLRLDLLVSGESAVLLQATLPLVPAALVHLALVFPGRPLWLRRRPWLLLVPYGSSIALGAARGMVLFHAPEAWIRLDQVAFLYCAGASLWLVGTFAYAARTSVEPVARERARVVLWGLVPAVLFVALGGLLRLATGSRLASSNLGLFGVWMWVASLAYAAVKRNIFEFEVVVRRMLTHSLLWAATIVAYGVVLGLSYRVLQVTGYSREALLPLLGVALVLPLVPGLFEAMRRRIEARLFPLRVPLVEMVQGLSEELSALMGTSEVCRRVQDVFRERMGVTRAVVYVAGENGFEALDAPAVGPEVREVAEKLARGDAVSVFFGGGRSETARRWMREQGFTLVLPLVARSRLGGFLTLGEPPGGRVFNSEDIDTLATLASRIAISLANARAYERVRDLEDRFREENRALREELELHPGIPEIVGQSVKMQALFRLIEQVATVDTTVLLLGETGTGKELVARAIHARSARRDGPLVKVNCAAIPSGLVESELFGHERGAFTDAAGRRHGKFELAQHGTLLLDEIAELPPDVQAKLLRVIQEREFERVGGTETLRADVRVIASTNRDLRTLVRSGRFREDLYFRLHVLPIVVPPLRERLEDVPLLVDHFIRRANEALGKNVIGVAPANQPELQRYTWPGNVRELENVIERAMVLSDGERLTIPPLDSPEPDRRPPAEPTVRSMSEAVRAAKIAAIDRALSL